MDNDFISIEIGEIKCTNKLFRKGYFQLLIRLAVLSEGVKRILPGAKCRLCGKLFMPDDTKVPSSDILNEWKSYVNIHDNFTVDIALIKTGDGIEGFSSY